MTDLSQEYEGLFISISFSYDWLVVLRINVDLAIFQPYLDLEAGDNQSLKIQVARPGIEPRSSCSASQELNHSATTAPLFRMKKSSLYTKLCMKRGNFNIIFNKKKSIL